MSTHKSDADEFFCITLSILSPISPGSIKFNDSQFKHSPTITGFVTKTSRKYLVFSCLLLFPLESSHMWPWLSMWGYSNSTQSQSQLHSDHCCASSTLSLNFLRSQGPLWLSRKHLVLPYLTRIQRIVRSLKTHLLKYNLCSQLDRPGAKLGSAGLFKACCLPLCGDRQGTVPCSDFSITPPHLSIILFIQLESWLTGTGYTTSLKGLTKDSLLCSLTPLISHGIFIWSGEKENLLWLILYPF